MIRKVMLFTLLTVFAVAAQAGVVYHADLIPEAVHSGSDASAYGEATLITSDDGTEIYLTLNFYGLDSAQTAANLLFGTVDEVGTVAMDLPLGSPMALTFDNTTELDTALINEALAIQVYSEMWPGGVIRGNFLFVIVGTETSSWTQVKTLFE